MVIKYHSFPTCIKILNLHLSAGLHIIILKFNLILYEIGFSSVDDSLKRVFNPV